MKFILIICMIYKTVSTQSTLPELFEKINSDTVKYNSIASEIAWDLTLHPGNTITAQKELVFEQEFIKWQHSTCTNLVDLENEHLLNITEIRQTYLLCRGVKLTLEETRAISSFYEDLESIYNDAEVCIPTTTAISKDNIVAKEKAILNYITKKKYMTDFNSNQDVFSKIYSTSSNNAGKTSASVCLSGESDFQELMRYSKDETVLKWLWLVWREKIAVNMLEPYRSMVLIYNKTAKRNGYNDLGAAWRDELEMPEIRKVCRQLYNRIRPLYKILHGVVRFYLRKHYGGVISEKEPIPAHLLGDLWSENWETVIDLIIPKSFDLDKQMIELNWTVEHMVRRAEDFYQSFGLPPMTEEFWQKSEFQKRNKDMSCHGTAADFYHDNDYRLLYCANVTSDSFYVLHHEMGHIEYFMAYANQPGIYRQANSAFHETIGDTIMLGVMTPQHLNRLGLVNETILYSNKALNSKSNSNIKDDNTESDNVLDEVTTDEILLLKQCLKKLPQIAFALVVDEYRWRYFEGALDNDNLNKEFWDLVLELQGVAPPVERGEEYFDIGAKYHVPDNTPYIRYFLSSFLQYQLFENLCQAAVYGHRGLDTPLPKSISLHRCDIYGSRVSGSILRDIMSRGHSHPWKKILKQTTGMDDLSPAALLRYYRPLYKLLNKLIDVNNIPIGW